MQMFNAIEVAPLLEDTCSGAERRTETRQWVREPAMLQLQGTAFGERVRVYILDVSANGIGLSARRGFIPGALVHVRMSGSVLIGEVRYSVQCGEEFSVGVRLQRSPWR